VSRSRGIFARVIPADGGSGLRRELARCRIVTGAPAGATGVVATGVVESAAELIVESLPADVSVASETGRIVAFGTRQSLADWLAARKGDHEFFARAARALELCERRHFDLVCPAGSLHLGERTVVMGILNVTPDSFSDGGKFFDPAAARERALQMVNDRVDIVDIGGMSTRPGSEPVTPQEELRRVIPVIEALAGELPVPISIDTCRADVARRAIEAGASIVNDVTALGYDPEMVDVVAEAGVPAVLMHMKGTPKNMQKNPEYDDLMDEVTRYLSAAAELAASRGVGTHNLIVDPGIGFGKTLEHNLELLDRLGEFRSLGMPVMVGTSRKSFIGMATGAAGHERLPGTAASVALAIARGAHIVRVHDVKEMVQVAGLADAVLQGRPSCTRVWTAGSTTEAP